MIILTLILLGLCFGSFTNALVWRMYKQDQTTSKKVKQKYSISKGRSMCTHCGHQLTATDLIPVFSWLWLKGKCRYCGKPIDDTPIAEVITPILFILSYVYWPLPWTTESKIVFVFWLVQLVGFVALALYDFKWYLLPNRIVFTLMAVAGAQVLLQLIFGDAGLHLLIASFWGALVGGGIFWVLFQVSKGKWIGGGDIKLGFLLGLLLGGAVESFMMIFIASLIGTLISIPLLLAKKLKPTAHLPFGPLLLVAAVVVRLFGASLISWYKNRVGL